MPLPSDAEHVGPLGDVAQLRDWSRQVCNRIAGNDRERNARRRERRRDKAELKKRRIEHTTIQRLQRNKNREKFSSSISLSGPARCERVRANSF